LSSLLGTHRGADAVGANEEVPFGRVAALEAQGDRVAGAVEPDNARSQAHVARGTQEDVLEICTVNADHLPRSAGRIDLAQDLAASRAHENRVGDAAAATDVLAHSEPVERRERVRRHRQPGSDLRECGRAFDDLDSVTAPAQRSRSGEPAATATHDAESHTSSV